MTLKNKIEPFKQSTLEMLCNIMGDTSLGLTGSEIHKFLLLAKIEDIDDKNTKRYRLYNAFVEFQKKNQCANNILDFIKRVLDPQLYIDNISYYQNFRSKINAQLAFEGFEISEKGGIIKLSNKAECISDIQEKINSFKGKLEKQGAHQKIFEYCNAELLADNYFHAVFEASKGLFSRIRSLSGLSSDGRALIEQTFSNNPILTINNFQSKSEKDEHEGFKNILSGLCGMFRNTEAHEPKISWNVAEQDACEILGLISYCHRRLDNAKKQR